MNIFYLDHDVRKCAEMHNDKHVVKMILEYAQLLSTAHRYLDGVPTIGKSATGRKKTTYILSKELDSVLYSATHINHPSAVWVRQSRENYMFLVRLFRELCKEYTHRYNKIHKCTPMLEVFYTPPKNIADGIFTEPTPAMPEEYKVSGDSITSYKNYYLGDKTRMFSWKNRETPAWIR